MYWGLSVGRRCAVKSCIVNIQRGGCSYSGTPSTGGSAGEPESGQQWLVTCAAGGFVHTLCLRGSAQL